MARSLIPVDIAIDTFEVWVSRTNDVVSSLATEVISANSSLGVTGNSSVGGTRNAHLFGTFSANTLVATSGIRGGNNASSANLTISSNTIITGVTFSSTANSLYTNTQYFTANVQANGTAFSILGTTATITSNVSITSANQVFNSNASVTAIKISGNSTSTNTTIGGNSFYVTANIVVTGTNHTIAGNVNIDGNTLFVDAANDRVGIKTTTPDASLSVNGTANVSGATRVGDTFTAVGAASLSSTLGVTGATTLSNTLTVSGNVALNSTGLHTVAGNVSFDTGTLFINSVNDRIGVNTTSPDASLTVNGTANVSGATRFGGNVVIAGASHTIAGNVNIDSGTLFIDATNDRIGVKNTTPDATVTITGTANVSGDYRVGGVTTLAGNVVVSGAAHTIAGNVNFDTGAVFVDALNNRLGIGTSTPDAALAVSGSANVSGDYRVGGNTTLAGNTTLSGTSHAVGGNVNFDTGTLFVDAANDRVGIKTTTPDATVTVTGTANVSGSTRIGGNTTLAGTLHTVSGNVNFDTATLFVDATNDRVGVGNSTPDATLTVTGSANVSGATRIGGVTTLAGNVVVSGTSHTVAGNVNFDSGTLFINSSNDRVGIGTATPDATLSVVGSANVSSDCRIGGNLAVVGTITGNVNFATGTVFVDSVNNRLGIGTSTPDATLSVNGTANVSGATRFGGNLTVVGTGAVTNTFASGNTTVTGFINVSSRATVSGNLQVNGTTTIGGPLTVNTNYVVDVTSNTNIGNNAASRVIYSWPKASYRSGKLMVFANNSGTNQVAEMVVAHDGAEDAQVTVYAVVASPFDAANTVAPLGTFNARINTFSSSVELIMNQIVSNTAVKVVAHLIV